MADPLPDNDDLIMQCETTPDEARGLYDITVSFFFSNAFTPSVVEGIGSIQVIRSQAELNDDGSVTTLINTIGRPFRIPVTVNQTSFSDELSPLEENVHFFQVSEYSVAAKQGFFTRSQQSSKIIGQLGTGHFFLHYN